MAALLCLVCLDVSAASHTGGWADGARPCPRASSVKPAGEPGGKTKAFRRRVICKYALMRSMSLFLSTPFSWLGSSRSQATWPRFKARCAAGGRNCGRSSRYKSPRVATCMQHARNVLVFLFTSLARKVVDQPSPHRGLFCLPGKTQIGALSPTLADSSIKARTVPQDSHGVISS
jgi:hypothetical protein